MILLLNCFLGYRFPLLNFNEQFLLPTFFLSLFIHFLLFLRNVNGKCLPFSTILGDFNCLKSHSLTLSSTKFTYLFINFSFNTQQPFNFSFFMLQHMLRKEDVKLCCSRTNNLLSYCITTFMILSASVTCE